MIRLSSIAILIIVYGLVLDQPFYVNCQDDLVDLKKDVASLTKTPNGNYYLYDSYPNTCLNKFQTCDIGITVVFNLTVVYTPMYSKTDYDTNYGRTVLVSSGGDSNFMVGGFYLHQLSPRGDNHLEFGITAYNDLYKSKIHIDDNSTVRLAFVWDRSVLNVYVDGTKYQTIGKPLKRTYSSLNYNPIKKVKSLVPIQSTIIYEAIFKDNLVASSDPLITGSTENYFIGCYELKNSINSNVKTNKLDDQSVISENDQCKTFCLNDYNQIYLIQNSQCICVKNKTELNDAFKSASCASSWMTYRATSLIFDVSDRFFRINVEKIVSREPVEIGDSIGFKISNEKSENFITYIDFDDNTVKNVIGNTILFHEYKEAGTNNVNITVVSLSDPSLVYYTNIEVRVSNPTDRQPMNYVSLNVTTISEKVIEANVIVSGGFPYSCYANYGETNKKDAYDSVARLNQFKMRYNYSYTGVYNVSVTCRSEYVIGSEVTDWSIVYLPNRTSSYLYTNENAKKIKYGLKNFKRMFVPRPISVDKDIELELPFSTASLNLKFQVVDLLDPTNVYEWINSKRFTPTGNLGLKVKAKYFQNLNDNYFQVRTENKIPIANYLITLVDPISYDPSITVLTQVPRQNQPVLFEIYLRKMSNAVLRIDFGDDTFAVYELSTNNASEIGQASPFQISHVYGKKNQEYTIKASLANNLFYRESKYTIQFASNLPTVYLTVSSNVTDVSQPVQFRLNLDMSNPLVQAGPIDVDLIKITFDEKSSFSPNSKTFTNFQFNSTNGYSLTHTFYYPIYGLFVATVNISNSVSFTTSRVVVKVGLNLNTAYGFVVNNYAAVNDYVFFNIRINGGNGYWVTLDFKDSNKMVLPWNYLASNGTKNERIVGYVPASAKFTPSGVIAMYKYTSAGLYDVVGKVSNPFGEIVLNFCTQVQIEDRTSGFPLSDSPNCLVKYNNLDLSLNGNKLAKGASFKMARGIENVLSVEWNSCEDLVITQSQSLITYWTLNQLSSVRGIDYESTISNYCLVKSTNNQLKINPNELDFGNYTLRVYAFDSSSPDSYALLSDYIIRMGSSPIVVNLNNRVSSYDLLTTDTLTLDFYDNTYDPDASNVNDKSSMNFYFVCTIDETGNAQDKNQNALAWVVDKAANSDFDLSPLNFSLAFRADQPNIYFYEKNCFYDRFTYETDPERNPIKFLNRKIRINADVLNLNQSATKPLLIQLFVSKLNRVGSSQQIVLRQDLNSFFISFDSDLSDISNKLDQLNDLAKTNPGAALNILSSFVDVINIKSDSQSSNQTSNSSNSADNGAFSQLRGKMLGTVGTIIGIVTDPDALIKAANATVGVTSNTDQMPIDNQRSGSMLMETLGNRVKEMAEANPEAVMDLTSVMLDSGANLFGAAFQTAPQMEVLDLDEFLKEENDTEPEPIPAKYEAPLELYQTDGEEFPEDIYEQTLIEEYEVFLADEEKREETADVARTTLKGISEAGTGLATATANGSNSTSNCTKIEKKGMALIVAKQAFNESDESGTTFSSDSSGTSIVMPPLTKVVNGSNNSAPASISSKMLVSASNPFQSSKGSASGTIVSLELTDENGNELEINGTAEPFNIKIPAQKPAKSFKSSVGLFGFTYYKTYLPNNDSSLHVMVKPDLPGDYYHIYIKYSETRVAARYPDETYFDYSFTAPNNRSFPDDVTGELKYTAFLPAEKAMGNGTYYIGVKLAVLNNDTAAKLRLFGNNSNITNFVRSLYTVRVFSTSCKYWKNDTKEWCTDGCYVGENTVFNQTECLCYHLTTFSTDFYVPPNTIDFSTVFSKFKSLNENAAVFATVITILGLYVIAGIISRHQDKKDLVKWGASPLIDNLPTDNHYYLISVQTGIGKDTATTSKVGFVLSGEWADSGVRKLCDEKRKAFKSGSVCNFIMSVEEPLGPLTYLRIWHDNSGTGRTKSWYLNVVSVVDLSNNEKSNFVCNNWLAVEKGDGQIDRLLPVACNNDLVSFKHLFTQSVKKKFTDSHLWFSVISRPTKSSFTRLQRISCCMSLLFCTMIANAMFYRSESNVASKSGVIQLGPIKFTMTQLYTSIISTLIVVPVNLIIVTIFRKSKLKHNGVVPTRNNHIAKQQYWRRVKLIENIELNDSTKSTSTIAGASASYDDYKQAVPVKKKSLLKRLFEKKRNNEYKRASKEDARNQKQGRNLPHWFLYIGWLLCVMSILVPAFFVILYSMQWGKERSNDWLVSMVFSFFQSLFVVDPIKVFAITAIITCILRKPDDDDESLIDSGDPYYNAIVNRDEEYLHNQTASLSQIDLREILESRRAKLTTLEPISSEELEKQRKERKNNIKMNEILREAASYLGFLVVVLFLSYQSRSKNSHLIHQDMANTFLTNEAMVFDEIRTREDFWTYVDNVFMPGIYAPVWYNNKSLTWREKLTTINRNSLRVGAPRIRQLRIKENTCRVSPKFRHMIGHCRENYNWVDDDTKDYDIGWTSLNKTGPAKANAKLPPNLPSSRRNKYKCKNGWCYQNTGQTKSAPIVGHFTTYKGGGYAVSLQRTLERSMKIIEELKENKWIDQLTRALFLEFTIYNPNVNLFSSATFIVEYLSTGAAVTYQSINVFQLYNYLGSFGIVVLVFEIIFVIFIIYFLVVEIIKLKNEKLGYFKQFWNLNELVIVVFSIISMAMFGMRTVFTNLAIKAVFESELGEFVNFNTIGLWDETFNGLSAIVVFCATLKFLKLLRFNKRIGLLAATLRYACNDLISFSFTFTIFFIAFTQFGYLIFGSMTRSYKDFLTSLETIFRFSLGQFDLGELQTANYGLGSIYFVVFILIVVMGLMSMFITILNEAFEEVKKDIEGQQNEHEIFDYMFNTFKSIGKKNKPNTNVVNNSINASNTSLRVQIKDPHLKQSKKNTPFYSASFKSLNMAAPMAQFDDHDSLSLY